jgi:1,4-dihydroxy-2-naphthoyl-CoA hydrolase
VQSAPDFEPNAMSIFKRRPDPDRLDSQSPGTLIETLGIKITELGEDYVRGTMPVDARTRQPFGLLHGGASVALAETLGSWAAWLCLDDPERQQAVGLEINANHVRGVREGMVTGTARPEHLGRSTQLWSVRIEDEQGRLVCLSRLTVAVVTRA